MLIPFMTRIITAGAFFAGMLAIGLGSNPTQALEGYVPEGEPLASALSDQIIVRLSGPASGRLDAMPLNAWRAAAGEPLRVVRAMSRNGLVLKLPAFRELPEVATIARRLVGVAGIADAEPDVMLFPQLVPDDSRYPEQWHYFEAAGGINLPLAWAITTGSPDIAVAVIDTGVRPHADLVARLLPGYDFIDDLWAANDGDGWDADASDPGGTGWHGTHVAGTVGAATDNSLGVTGVTWDTGVLPVRVMGAGGGYTSDILDGMVWASGMPDPWVPPNPHPAKVLNLSLGGVSACTPAFQGVIDDIVAYGATVVVAAANGNTDAMNYQPANCANVITVAATDRAGNRAGSSNYGSAVEISAPGVSILSTSNTGTTVPGDDTYAWYSGTSMASPQVAGVAGLMYSLDPDLTPAQIVEFLQENARPFPTGSTCYDPVKTCGAGIVDAAATLDALVQELPAVEISAPASGAVFEAGQNIIFTGTATDPQDGDLTASLTWTSSLSGWLGTGGTLTRSLVAGTHVITAYVTDASGLKVSQRVKVTVTSASVTFTFTSLGGEDGQVLELKETSNTGSTATSAGSVLRVGDDAADRQYKLFLSFDTSGLPDGATIESATVRLQRSSLTGTNPFTTHGQLLADIQTGGFGGATALAKGDFQAAATATGVASLSNAASDGAWSEGGVDARGLVAVNKTGKTQFRIYFAMDDNDDMSDDYLGYYAGENATANRPQLVVTYRF